MTATNDFARLLSAAKLLGKSGDTARIRGAQELLPAFEAAFREAADDRIEQAATR